MKEQLISFETAKLAKEKGFESVIGLGHRKPRGNYFNSDGELNGDVTKELVNKDFKSIAAPTQSLLQKWLREEHQLYVMIEETHTYALKTRIGFYAKIVTPSGEDEFDEHGFRFIKKLYYDTWFDSTYENALEKGLEEALKLIK